MDIRKIITNRRIDPHHANALLFEWEDDLCNILGATLHYNKSCQNSRYSKFIPVFLSFIQTYEPAFTLEMCVYRHNGNNKKNIIPCILDYYIHNVFLAKMWCKILYNRNQVLCVSSPEVYDFLSNDAGIKKVRLLPQTLSDRYRISEHTVFNKKYDMFIAGRQNPVLMEWFNRYLLSHRETTFIISKRLQNGEFHFFDQDGNCLSNNDSRETYITFMRSAKACMYSPQGIDNSRKTNGFGQVTPHFLEIVACGCHPLLRYTTNIDTAFFQLDLFCPHIDNYEQFESLFDKARSEKVDMKKHSDYMQGHYTSVIAEELKNIAKLIS